jgi:predicted nuclease of predicted toxin-antitoxin system
MRFLIDAQLPPALASGWNPTLRTRGRAHKALKSWGGGGLIRLILSTRRLGHEAEHVADRQMAAASDRQIWDHALAVEAVIVTKDEDFAQRKALGENGPRVVWVRIRNTRRRELLVWFDSAVPTVLAALERGENLIELV